MRMRLLVQLGVALGVALGLAACACAPTSQRSASGQVGVSEVDTAVPAESRMTLSSNETFQPPLPAADNAIPIFPTDLLAQRLSPQALCLRVSIDERGAVIDSAPLATGPDCPEIEQVAPAFYEAAQEAVNAWRFDPAFRCIYPDGAEPDPQGGCWGEGVKEEAQAVSLAYRFMFEQVDGKGAVRLGN